MRDIQFFYNRYYFLAGMFVIVQQLIVASSTYFMAKLGEQFGNGVINSYYLLSHLSLSIFLPIFLSFIWKKANLRLGNLILIILAINFWVNRYILMTSH